MENVEKHLQVLGALYIAAGVLFFIPAVIVSAATMLPGLISGDLTALLILSTIGSFVALFLMAMAAPCMIGGDYLLKKRQWARTLLIVLGLLILINVPVGTALGGYTLWVLSNDKAAPVFEEFT